MKVCAQCNQQVNDFEDFCPRCGSSNLVAQGQPMQRPQQRPPQQRPPQQRPPQQRPPQQGGYYDDMGGQRPPQQRPPQQRPPQQGGYSNPNGQRPPQQRPPQQRPPQQGGYPNGQRPPQQRPPQQPQNQHNGLDEIDDFDLGTGVDLEPNGKKRRGLGPKKPKEKATPMTPNTGLGMEDAYEEGVVEFKDWLFLYLKMLIPLFNIFVFFKTLIGSPKIPKSMTNAVRASLVMVLISVLLSIVLSVAIGGSLLAALG